MIGRHKHELRIFRKQIGPGQCGQSASQLTGLMDSYVYITGTRALLLPKLTNREIEV